METDFLCPSCGTHDVQEYWGELLCNQCNTKFLPIRPRDNLTICPKCDGVVSVGSSHIDVSKLEFGASGTSLSYQVRPCTQCGHEIRLEISAKISVSINQLDD